jgi:phosphoglucosamine mutase
MSRSYFGTDGVRGPVGGPLINPSFASRLGQAAARWLKTQAPAEGPLTIVIGRDTRASGPALELAIAAGFAAEGCVPVSLGVLPTPAVARAVRSKGAALGVVITASHNPASDNGIKFFAASGMKLTDEQEEAIESLLPAQAVAPLQRPLPVQDEIADYIAVTRAVLPAGSLRGWRIVLDTAHGATCVTSSTVLRELGADLISVGSTPDGSNINDSVGSEHPEKLAARVLQTGASLGIAHDGDGDRCILCDEHGVVLDGDEILVILGTYALRQDKLSSRTLVVTVQSNLGVDRAIAVAHGLVSRSAVGDRYVIERMLQVGSNLGGESSGHVICSDISPTGDGLVAALKVIEVMLATGQPLSVLRTSLQKFPQRTKALKVREKLPLETLPHLPAVLATLEEELGAQGRLLVRYSGTEAKLRLLVEGPDDTTVSAALARIEAAVRQDLVVL